MLLRAVPGRLSCAPRAVATLARGAGRARRSGPPCPRFGARPRRPRSAMPSASSSMRRLRDSGSGRRPARLAPAARPHPLGGRRGVAGVVTPGADHRRTGPMTTSSFDNTLEYPFGYRNANAAFFLCAFFPALGLASDRTARLARCAARRLAHSDALPRPGAAEPKPRLRPGRARGRAVYLLAAPVAAARDLLAGARARLCAVGVLPALTDLYGRARRARGARSTSCTRRGRRCR